MTSSCGDFVPNLRPLIQLRIAPDTMHLETKTIPNSTLMTHIPVGLNVNRIKVAR